MFVQTRPLYITRQILYVATSSAARAQELSFQRYTLLKRLNKQLPFELKDIRFSSSGWHQKTYEVEEQPVLFTISDRHKAKATSKPGIANQQLDQSQNSSDRSPQDKAKEAVKRWIKTVEQRASVTLSCPKCNSPTAKSELARWKICHHCAAQEWSENYRVPDFSESE